MASRRRFLSLSSASLVCASFAHSLLGQASARLGIPVFSGAATGAAQQGLLTAANFEKLVGSSFHAFLDNDVVAEIVLLKVKIPTYSSVASTSQVAGSPVRPVATPARRAARATNTFMLLFSTGSTLIPQDTYVLDSGILGSFSALVVPAQPVAGNQIAVATFSFL
jgi:hypothetical protein